ncbi:serine/threonine-protein kinase [Synechococcus sp. L2F]|uniref:serine/threonine-protein kinase n=1 Tax=Synechococcus sp. L2F TaxID=2823739 RepID=UPI0020CF7B71|nr:serine/threonine-protein kinase [Synechococcus sp. L2F]
MSSLKQPIVFETAFASYTAESLLGEGGAGRVYGANAPDGSQVAVKLLAQERASRDKRGRFKNELAFLLRNSHKNIVTVTDHGLIKLPSVSGPFYVMRRFDCSLRTLLLESLDPQSMMRLLAQLLDGVEAAHLQGVVHRDLKPENVLFDRKTNVLAVADFGVSSFTEDALATIVETKPTQRLANFLYAAPEQRAPGRKVGIPADLYAIGLMLNELFTKQVPHGTDYKTVASASPDFWFLDAIVSLLLRQDPNERPQSVAAVKQLIQRYSAEAVSQQRLSELSKTVISATEVDDPLAINVPVITSADWSGNRLTLTLDQPISQGWIQALLNMGSYTSAWGRGPERFRFHGNTAIVQASEHEVQQVIDHFKGWLPKATGVYKNTLEQQAKREEYQQRQKLQQEREAEERRLRVLNNIRLKLGCCAVMPNPPPIERTSRKSRARSAHARP